MAWPFSQLNISYGVSSNALLSIPAGSNFNDFVSAIARNGFWTTQNINTAQPSSATFVPPGEITSIVAQ